MKKNYLFTLAKVWWLLGNSSMFKNCPYYKPYIGKPCIADQSCVHVHRYFTQGALDIYNCQTAQIINCTFEHNGPVSVNKFEQYRGHAGGLSVGYHHNTTLSTRPQLRVERCTFRNNTSNPLASIQRSTTQILQQGVYTGRGGGCAIIIIPSLPLNGTMEDCVFEKNFAKSYGGALYITFDGELDHLVVLDRVRLAKNFSPTGGGLVVGYGPGSALDSVSSLLVNNSDFVENEAKLGAGLYLITAGEYLTFTFN